MKALRTIFAALLFAGVVAGSASARGEDIIQRPMPADIIQGPMPADIIQGPVDILETEGDGGDLGDILSLSLLWLGLL